MKKTIVLGAMATVLALPSVSFVMHANAETQQSVEENKQEQKVASFTDLKNSHWAYKHILNLYALGVTTGYKDGTFKPEKLITREEATKMIIAELGYKLKEQESFFKDVQEGSWSEEYINLANEKRIITGYPDGTFGPTDNLTRAELAAILVRAYDLKPVMENAKLPFADVSKKHWSYKNISTLYQNRGITGYKNGDFGPDTKVTRAEFSTFLDRIINPDENDITLPPLKEESTSSYDESTQTIKNTGTTGNGETVTFVIQIGEANGMTREEMLSIGEAVSLKIAIKAIAEQGYTVTTQTPLKIYGSSVRAYDTEGSFWLYSSYEFKAVNNQGVTKTFVAGADMEFEDYGKSQTNVKPFAYAMD